MNAITQKILEERSYTLQFVQGYNKDENPEYAFIVFNLKHFNNLKNKSVNLKTLYDDGIVILKGNGHYVPDWIKYQALYLFQSRYLKTA